MLRPFTSAVDELRLYAMMRQLGIKGFQEAGNTVVLPEFRGQMLFPAQSSILRQARPNFDCPQSAPRRANPNAGNCGNNGDDNPPPTIGALQVIAHVSVGMGTGGGTVAVVGIGGGGANIGGAVGRNYGALINGPVYAVTSEPYKAMVQKCAPSMVHSAEASLSAIAGYIAKTPGAGAKWGANVAEAAEWFLNSEITAAECGELLIAAFAAPEFIAVLVAVGLGIAAIGTFAGLAACLGS